MEKEYDVIIVGAGVAGFTLAHFLNDTNLKVLLIDKRKDLNKLENIRFCTTMELVNACGLKKAIKTKYKSFAFGLDDPKTWAISKHDHDPFIVIDMEKFAKNVNLECDKALNCEIVSIQRKKGIVEVKDKDKNTYYAKIIVDCSGPAEIVAKMLGIPRKRDPTYFYNTSLELTNCNIPEKYSKLVSFPGTKKYTNILLWFYPYSRTECQFGHTDWGNKRFPIPKNQEKTIYHLMKKVYPYNVWFKNAKIKSRVRRPSAATITRHIYADNYLACGEAAGATPPALGEGSRAGIYMAKYAQQAIAEAFEYNDFSSKRLKIYDRLFQDGIGKYYRNCEIIRYLAWHYIDEEDYPYIFSQILTRLNEREYIDFLMSRFTFRVCFKLLGLEGMRRVLKNMIKRHIFGIKIEDKRFAQDEKI